MCGEKSERILCCRVVLGSPPRVRGKGYQGNVRDFGRRITPACAGKRAFSHSSDMPARDHPRVCGEKGGAMRFSWLPKGSPPRVRGKVKLVRSDQKLVGITPACAGKSRLWTGMWTSWKDHPRVCGEKKRTVINRACKMGSPPRVRGKVLRAEFGASSVGITPACAGKSPCTPGFSASAQDHPRVCGEKFFATSAVPPLGGSPPRVRGKAIRTARKAVHTGITPACAGKRRAGFPMRSR